MKSNIIKFKVFKSIKFFEQFFSLDTIDLTYDVYFMMIDFYHLAKTPIGIWCMRNSNLDPLFDNKKLYDVNPLKVY
jgi:hypothetical protein